MEPNLATTPFGRRPLTLAHVAAELTAKKRAPEASAHKWGVFRALCAAKGRLGLSERALAVLDALLSFHPETVLSGEGLIVFPSNAQLSLRAHGMAASTLRRHLASLVEAGIVLRRDSPNGKRYARKGRDGTIATAYGFDLSPLVARAPEFEALAEEARAEERALLYAKERISLARRDLVKMIALGVETKVSLPCDPSRPSTWPDLHAAFRRLVEETPRTAGLAELEGAAAALAALADHAAKALENHAKTQNVSGNESQIEQHIHNSNPKHLSELEPAFQENGSDGKLRKPNTRVEAAFSLSLVLSACPDIADFARGGIAQWRDFLAAAGVARSALGVSPSAWEAARAAMGETTAGIAVAAMLQRASAIANPGGYLRELTRKAEAGQFSIGPMLMALVGARNRQDRRA